MFGRNANNLSRFEFNPKQDCAALHKWGVALHFYRTVIRQSKDLYPLASFA